MRETPHPEMRSALMNIFSHEFRTPFAVIQSCAELLKMSLPGETSQDQQFLSGLAQNILREIEHVTGILNRVVLLNQLESSGTPEQAEPVEVEVLIRRLLDDSFQPWKDGRQVSFSVKGQPRKVRVDPVMLDLVCRNLVDNACKYSPDRPAPFISLTFRPSGWSLSVKDFGIGIPPTEMGNLGTPFYRGSNVGSASGTGLGLSIVRYVVERYEGQLVFDSEVGEGTTATVAFVDPVRAELPMDRPARKTRLREAVRPLIVDAEALPGD
jgi:signal transduction histidine kinase